MQTFLPYPDFKLSAMSLDNKRLGKQRVEAKQIMLALTTDKYGWKNHPATKLWTDRIHDLASYGVFCCIEWQQRGFKDSLFPFFVDYLDVNRKVTTDRDLGHALHHSHRANLVYKDYWHYHSQFSDIPVLLTKPDYVWEDTHDQAIHLPCRSCRA